MLTMTPSSINNALVVTDTSEDANSPVEYETPTDDSVDPLLLDYVAPINGDARRLAEGVFDTGYAWARSPTIRDCVQRRSLSAGEAPWAVATADWYAAHGSPAGAELPALQAIAEGAVDSPPPDAPLYMLEAVTWCARTDNSKASRWKRDLEPLQVEFAATVERVVAEVEFSPVWEQVQGCLTRVDAPTTGGHGIKGYVDRLADEQSTGDSRIVDRPGTTSGTDDDDGGTEASEGFAACVAPFYAAVEQRLVVPRTRFVEKYRNELMELQTEFATFA
jgi:hypothetical protein